MFMRSSREAIVRQRARSVSGKSLWRDERGRAEQNVPDNEGGAGESLVFFCLGSSTGVYYHVLTTATMMSRGSSRNLEADQVLDNGSVQIFLNIQLLEYKYQI